MKKLLLVIFVGLILNNVISRPIYNFKTSYVTQLTDFNFKDQVIKIRQNTNYVSVVHFYSMEDSKSPALVPEIDQWTNEYGGVFRVGAVDCDVYPKICAEEKVTTYPTFRIYAPVPMPVQTLTDQDDLSIKNIQKKASKYLHSNCIEITNTNLKTFLGQNPSVPKVLLFTDKKGVPMVYKGLSVAFQKKLNFGIVRSTDEILVDKYRIKKFPSIILMKNNDKKHESYKGQKFNFRSIFEFLNIYSQVFVPGGGSSLDSSATKQWMTQIFPQMYGRSAKDICLGIDGILCVMLLTNEKPNKQIKDQFEQLNARFDRKIERGAKFKFMWMNVEIQKPWGQLFQYTGQNKVVILNPGKRKRYTTHQGTVQKDSIASTLEGITGGNAHFKRISQLPSFQVKVE